MMVVLNETSTIGCWSVVGYSMDYQSVQFWIILLLAGLFTLVVIGGNLLVIAAVASMDALHTTTNFLIVSLAVSDLSLGLFILPFSIFLLLSNQVWPFGYVWCQMYLAIDVWMSTASIYNLLAISFDRFMALWKPIKYKFVGSFGVCRVLVLAAYIIPLAVALPPVIIAYFEERDDGQLIRGNHSLCECSPMNNSQGYVIYSALSSFFIPLLFIITLNAGIYYKARIITTSHKIVALKKKKEKEALEKLPNSSHHLTAVATLMSGKMVNAPKKKESHQELRIHRGKFNPERKSSVINQDTVSRNQRFPKSISSHDVQKTSNSSDPLKSRRISSIVQNDSAADRVRRYREFRKDSAVGERLRNQIDDQILSPILKKNNKENCKHRSMSETETKLVIKMNILANKKKRAVQRSETRVAKTVGIVIGCFIICWLPFSLIYFIQAFIEENLAMTKPILFSIAFWLGYFNSGVNPIIYASCSRDFRKAFKKILNSCIPRKEGLMKVAKQANTNRFRQKFNENMEVSTSSINSSFCTQL